MHRRTHDGIKPLKCFLCKKGFAHPSTLTAHIREHHHKERRYQCGEEGCTAAFSRRSALNEHIQGQHAEEKPQYPCQQEGCTMVFSRPSNMKRHLAQQHKEKKYACTSENCGRTFSHEVELESHRQIHKEGHKCPFQGCGALFAHKSGLKRHQDARHTTQEKYLCGQCGKAFRHKSSLKKHTEKQHPAQEFAAQKRGQGKNHHSQNGKDSSDNCDNLKSSEYEAITIACDQEGCGAHVRDIIWHYYLRHPGRTQTTVARDQPGCSARATDPLAHYKTYRPKTMCTWPACGRTVRDIAAHYSLHTGSQCFPCPWGDCLFTSTLKREISFHVASKHQGTAHKCRRCANIFWNVNKQQFKDHQSACRSQFQVRRATLRNSNTCTHISYTDSTTCANPPIDGLYLCESHLAMRTQREHAINSIDERKNILLEMTKAGAQISEALSLDQKRFLACLVEQWRTNPKSILIGDLEMNVTTNVAHQVAIQNACGEWVVSPTVFVSREDLVLSHTLSTNGSYNMTVNTWAGVARTLESYIAKNGHPAIFLEWSRNGCDYRWLSAGLMGVTRVSLLPRQLAPMLSPLYWFQALAGINPTLGKLKRGLSNTYLTLFPHDTQLASRAHWADADVDMLVRIIEFFFSLLEDAMGD